MRLQTTIIIMMCIVVMVAFASAGCGSSDTGTPDTGSPTTTTAGIDSNTTDEMWEDFRSGAEIDVFKKDGRVYTVDYGYELSELAGYDEMKDGGYYKVTADVNFLNGGVAGYVDYPQIEQVISIKSIPAPDSPEN